jgi:hypothetical protein
MNQSKGAFYNHCNYKRPKGKADFLLGSMFACPFSVTCPKVVEWNSQTLSEVFVQHCDIICFLGQCHDVW